jgi:hypothetical protein
MWEEEIMLAMRKEWCKLMREECWRKNIKQCLWKSVQNKTLILSKRFLCYPIKWLRSLNRTLIGAVVEL